MGAIGRKLGNSITTAGKVLPTAVNNTSVSGVTALPVGINVGSMVLLSTQTASTSASISFTSGIDSTYKEYMFIFNNMHPATNGTNFQFNGSSDGGSNYNVTKTTTFFKANLNEGDTDNNFGYASGNDLAQSTAYQDIAEYTGNDNDGSVSGTLHLFSPSSTTFVKHFLANVHNLRGSDYAQNQFAAGYFNTASAINAIDFKFASGNIDAGTIQMFGVK